MRLGFKLFAEAYSPTEIVAQAARAEQAGFDFVEVSDHFHPWVPEHQHSGFAFSMLAAAAARTSTIELATGVTCPIIRYHPAVVAQAAATMALLSEGRFILGIGAGERLNEHVVGNGWPTVSIRHEMLREALEIIRLLWSGGYHSYQGKHLRLEDARVFDLPDSPPQIAVAAGGPAAARIAGELGDALFATEPREDLVTQYRSAGGQGSRYGEVPLAWATTEDEAAVSAHRLFRFGMTGWKVQAELPNPVNFDAASRFITPEHLKEQFGCGPDVARHVEIARPFVAAGYDRLALINAGPDMDGFFDFFTKDLGPALRKL